MRPGQIVIEYIVGVEYPLEMDATPPPLIAPPFEVSPPSRFEQACLVVPLVGWLIAAGLEDRRQRPRNQFIARQIAAPIFDNRAMG